ncbi:outer membrane lipoprotein-sorting protein [Leptospira ilyithenensis]|uniref:Outer membrane lipoprotein-sorting protein n=1 Tax=Leptospira ilyithenensis TaxID=2484901 RepID=A0A4V3JX16_9LEPT|nr:outer membrane lipoprotein-sorting protein [Leptospira ilyithenensis]TGN10071.1 outer membrane lipoprotein-sorting protein [Leptospira ilyithenensis]
MRNILIYLFLVLTLPCVLNAQGAASPDSVLSAQELLARLDRELDYGKGLVKGSYILIRRNGQSETWKINRFFNGEDALYLFDRKGRGLESKLLTKDEGENIYFFNVLSAKLFKKTDDEKYEALMGTGFFYIDLSGYSYQANYNPLVNGELEIGGEFFYRVSLKPILPYFYKKLVLLIGKKDLKPYRIDFHDKDGILFKTLNLKYGPVKIKDSSKVEELERASRWEMLDLNTGSITVWEIQEVDKSVAPDQSLFAVDNLSR